MKNYFFTIIASSLLLCCHHEQNEQIIPEEPEPEAPYVMPCGCGDEWPQEDTTCDRELPWDYPVKPGMEEWNKLKGVNEMIAACQIPEEVLSSLSTEDLAEICLQYPMIDSYLIYTTYEQGLNALVRQFNGIRELYQREDAWKTLLKSYRCRFQNRNLSFLLEPATTVIEKGLYFLPTNDSEILLSHYQSLYVSKEVYMEILQQLFCGYEKKWIYLEGFSHKINFYSRAIMLIKIDPQNLEMIPQGYSNRIFWIPTIDEPTLRAINDLSCQYITH